MLINKAVIHDQVQIDFQSRPNLLMDQSNYACDNPRKHMTAEWNSEKQRQHLSQYSTWQ